MMLNSLRNIDFSMPGAGDRAWFAHFQDHIEILQAIKSKKNVNLTIYPIFPFNREAIEDMLIRHQQYHDDMNGVLQLNGTDLQQLDLKDKKLVQSWVNQNFYEHYEARAALKI